MVSMAADATARESGKSRARAVLAQVESDRSIVPDVQRLPAEDLVTIRSRVEVPPSLKDYMRRVPSGGSEAQVRRLGDGLVAEVTRTTAGTLIAEGDSWFDYPFHDVLTNLEDDFKFDVESAAHRGDTLESMAYSEAQIAGLYRIIDKAISRGDIIRGILISGGGNDLAGPELGVLLNHSATGDPHLSESVMRGVIDERSHLALLHLLSWITEAFASKGFPRVPIFVHGYDYPVPDGRGFVGGFGPLPGPWLEPSFRAKAFNDMPARIAIMRTIIDRFNAMVKSVSESPSFPHVHFVDLRGTLSTSSDYRDTWANELHPTGKGFKSIAALFATAIHQASLVNTVDP